MIIGYAGTLRAYDPNVQKSGPFVQRIKRWTWEYTVNNINSKTRCGYFLFVALKLFKEEYPDLVDKIQVRLWGAIHPDNLKQIRDLGIDDIVTIGGYVDRAESMQRLRECDVLFLPLETSRNRNRPLFIPGKLYEYLRVGKPILGLMTKSDCSTILHSSGLGLTCSPVDTRQIAKSIAYLIKNENHLKDIFVPNVQEINKYGFEIIGRYIAEIFDQTETDSTHRNEIIGNTRGPLVVLASIYRLILQPIGRDFLAVLRNKNRAFMFIVMRRIKTFVLPFRVHHVFGPKHVVCKENELVVVCLVRNGEYYVQDFISYYRGMGVKHIVFMDNESSDNTVKMISEYEDISLVQTQLKYRSFKYQMKEYLIKKYGYKQWCLSVDIDEYFDYPHSDSINIEQYLDYLNSNGYDSVVTQMLDMFSNEPLMLETESNNGVSILERYRYYDTSKIRKNNYEDWCLNQYDISNEKIKLFRDGIRYQIFKVAVLLSKHSLVKYNRNLKIVDHHKVAKSHVADVSCVLYHYKFTDSFYAQVVSAVEEGNYWNDSLHYRKYLNGLEKDSSITAKRDTSRVLTSVNDLVENGFLITSDQYQSWIESTKEPLVDNVSYAAPHA